MLTAIRLGTPSGSRCLEGTARAIKRARSGPAPGLNRRAAVNAVFTAQGCVPPSRLALPLSFFLSAARGRSPSLQSVRLNHRAQGLLRALEGLDHPPWRGIEGLLKAGAS